jgi:hypothetical protein
VLSSCPFFRHYSWSCDFCFNTIIHRRRRIRGAPPHSTIAACNLVLNICSEQYRFNEGAWPYTSCINRYYLCHSEYMGPAVSKLKWSEVDSSTWDASFYSLDEQPHWHF